MERYIGIDVHASSSTCSVLKASGKQVRRDVVETNGKALIGYLKQIAGNLHVCIEEAEWSQWLVEILTPHVAEIVIVRKPWRPGAKNDALDAHDLAEQICTGRFECQVYKDPKRFTALRDLARAYIMVTQDRARTKNRIKSIFRGRGIVCRTGAIFSPEGQAKARRGLPAATRQVVALLGRELELLSDLKHEAEKAMLRASHRHAIARQLETAPGIGPIRAAQLLPIVVTPHRFRTKRQFWAYCGFGVVTRTSADWIQQDGCWVRAKVNRTRGLNFNHNRRLKAIFKGAATTVIAHAGPSPLQEHYEKLLAEGTKPNLAKLTIARRIAAIVLAMWKQGERYDAKKVHVRAAV